MKIYYSDHYTLPLPSEHRFPIQKYRMLRDFLLSEHIVATEELTESPIASEELLLLAHTQSYVDRIRTGSVSRDMLRRIEVVPLLNWTGYKPGPEAGGVDGKQSDSNVDRTAKVRGGHAAHLV